LVPPFVSHVVGIVEGILALRQGVRSLSLGYGQGGNMFQDIAALKSLRFLANEYFEREGFSDYELTTVFHQWMGGFPEDEAKAFAVISWGASVATLAGANKIIVKTPHEASGIPTAEANVQGLRCTRQAVNMLRDHKFPIGPDHQAEIDQISKEVRHIMDAIYRLGDGDVEAGTVAAFASGALDIPFAPSVYNYGKILPMRDNEGYIRVFNRGNVALSDEIMEFHREKLNQRALAESREVCFQMVTDDIYAISKGRLVGRPR
jgi:methylaspartate mutase epsilon subunit